VRSLGLAVGAELLLGDHQPVALPALTRCSAGQKAILTTAKDYWRNPEVFAAQGLPVFILGLSLKWDEVAMGRLIKRLL
jgi:tetraacyldisaccharide-1-P 4'-kinase